MYVTNLERLNASVERMLKAEELPLDNILGSMTRDEVLAVRKAYTEAVEEFIKAKIAKEVQGETPEELQDPNREDRFYLPHWEVFDQERATTKCRVVFDASAKSGNGKLLNDCLLAGDCSTEKLLHRNVPTSGSFEPDVGTFLLKTFSKHSKTGFLTVRLCIKTILKRSQTILMASTFSLLQARSSLFSSVIGLQPACFRLQSACNRLDRACNRLVFICNRLATGSIEPVISLLQADCRRKQADYRLDRACCKNSAQC